MNAASVLELETAAGMISAALCFELRVGLELGNSRAEYWQDYAEYSQTRFFPTRVVKLSPNVKAPAYGAFSGDRLSGMLPFLAYYLASAPGNSQIWLGEKRAEVLRVENMPAGLRYDPSIDPFSDSRVEKRDQRTRIGTLGGSVRGLRKVTIESAMDEGKSLVDQEIIGKGGELVHSTITVLEKNGSVIDSWNQDLNSKYM